MGIRHYMLICMTCIIGRTSTQQSQLSFFTRMVEAENRVTDETPLYWNTDYPEVWVCSGACHSNPLCESFFHNPTTGRCTIHSSVYNLENITESETDSSYYVRIPPTCPLSSGYTYIRRLSLCYKLYMDKNRAQLEGKALCEEDGGRLLKPNNKEKTDYLSDLDILKPHVHVWVDGKCDGGGNVMNDWKQDNGDPVEYLSWLPGQPNGICTDNCLAIRPAGFNDLHCNNFLAVFCELVL